MLDTSELCLRYMGEGSTGGYYVIPWLRCHSKVEDELITSSVVCYGSPGAASDKALRELMRSAKSGPAA